MAARKATAEDLKRIEELAKGWGKIVVRQYWGEKGPGLDVDLTQMEDVAMAAVRAMLAGTLEVATQQQASQLGEQLPCPGCGRMCPLKHEVRSITVRDGGSFAHDEPKAHCPACRRDFFPSASDTEAGRTQLQSVDLEQDRTSGGPLEVVPSGRQDSQHGG